MKTCKYNPIVDIDDCLDYDSCDNCPHKVVDADIKKVVDSYTETLRNPIYQAVVREQIKEK